MKFVDVFNLCVCEDEILVSLFKEREGDTVSTGKKEGREGKRDGKNKQDHGITNSVVVSIILSNGSYF